MKKKLLLLMVLGLVSFTPANAREIDAIIPYQLTKEDSGGYHYINNASEKIFSQLVYKIKIDKNNISDTFQADFDVNQSNKYRDDNYHYVSYKYAELMYNKATGDLTEISVEKFGSPKSYAIYDYPTGRLKYIKVYDDAMNRFIKYNPYGAPYTLQEYIGALNVRLTRRLNNNLSSKPDTPIRIYISIDKNGNIVESAIKQPSGNEVLDNEILDIVKKTAPFDRFEQDFNDNIRFIYEYRPLINNRQLKMRSIE